MSTDLIKHTTTSTVLIDDVEIPVEFANDPVEGLSGRDDLAVNTGMLFDLDGHPVITMRGMKFSLDIIWIGEDKKVVDISRNTLVSVLGNDTLYTPEKPAQYALEINAGEAQKRGIKVGNEVEINLLPNSDLTRLLVLEEVLDYLAKAVPGEKLEYLKPGENPPEGIQIQRGARGGRGYYPSEVTGTEEESTLEPTEEREVSAVQAPKLEHPPTSTLVEGYASAEQLGTRYGRIVPRNAETGEPPTHLYRVMDKRQYDDAVASKEKVLEPAPAEFGGDGRIHAAGKPNFQYADPTPTVLVAIEYSDDDGWAARQAGRGDITAATDNPIPISKVTVLAEGVNGRELRDNYKLISDNLSPEAEAETSYEMPQYDFSFDAYLDSDKDRSTKLFRKDEHSEENWGKMFDRFAHRIGDDDNLVQMVVTSLSGREFIGAKDEKELEEKKKAFVWNEYFYNIEKKDGSIVNAYNPPRTGEPPSWVTDTDNALPDIPTDTIHIDDVPGWTQAYKYRGALKVDVGGRAGDIITEANNVSGVVTRVFTPSVLKKLKLIDELPEGGDSDFRATQFGQTSRTLSTIDDTAKLRVAKQLRKATQRSLGEEGRNLPEKFYVYRGGAIHKGLLTRGKEEQERIADTSQELLDIIPTSVSFDVNLAAAPEYTGTAPDYYKEGVGEEEAVLTMYEVSRDDVLLDMPALFHGQTEQELIVLPQHLKNPRKVVLPKIPKYYPAELGEEELQRRDEQAKKEGRLARALAGGIQKSNLSKLLSLTTGLEYLVKAVPGEKLEYLKPGEQAPKGIQVQRGARGGRGYYPSEVTAVEEEAAVLEEPTEEREIDVVQAPEAESTESVVSFEDTPPTDVKEIIAGLEADEANYATHGKEFISYLLDQIESIREEVPSHLLQQLEVPFQRLQALEDQLAENKADLEPFYDAVLEYVDNIPWPVPVGSNRKKVYSELGLSIASDVYATHGPNHPLLSRIIEDFVTDKEGTWATDASNARIPNFGSLRDLMDIAPISLLKEWYGESLEGLDRRKMEKSGPPLIRSTLETIAVIEHRVGYQSELSDKFIEHFANQVDTFLTSDLKEGEKLLPPLDEWPENFKKRFQNLHVIENPSTRIVLAIDELYKSTKFGLFHSLSKEDWEQDSSKPYSGILKDAASRVLDGPIVFHNINVHDRDGNAAAIASDIEDSYERFSNAEHVLSKDFVDSYMQVQKQLTSELLEVAFPGVEEFELFRGVDDINLHNDIEEPEPWDDMYDEESDEWVSRGEARRILAESDEDMDSDTPAPEFDSVFTNITNTFHENPIASWSLDYKAASSHFAEEKEYGVVLRRKVSRDDIWTSFLTHAYDGNEYEMIVIPHTKQFTLGAVFGTGRGLDLGHKTETDQWGHAKEGYAKEESLAMRGLGISDLFNPQSRKGYEYRAFLQGIEHADRVKALRQDLNKADEDEVEDEVADNDKKSKKINIEDNGNEDWIKEVRKKIEKTKTDDHLSKLLALSIGLEYLAKQSPEREYLAPGEEAPEGVRVERGQRGGRYYTPDKSVHSSDIDRALGTTEEGIRQEIHRLAELPEEEREIDVVAPPEPEEQPDMLIPNVVNEYFDTVATNLENQLIKVVGEGHQPFLGNEVLPSKLTADNITNAGYTDGSKEGVGYPSGLGINSYENFTVTIGTGFLGRQKNQFIYKMVPGENRGEILAYSIDRTLGLNIVPFVKQHSIDMFTLSDQLERAHGDPIQDYALQEMREKGVDTRAAGHFQEFCDNCVGRNEQPKIMAEMMSTEKGREEFFKIMLLDYITGNSDRHTGNYLITEDGKIVAIDNGMIAGTRGPHSAQASLDLDPNTFGYLSFPYGIAEEMDKRFQGNVPTSDELTDEAAKFFDKHFNQDKLDAVLATVNWKAFPQYNHSETIFKDNFVKGAANNLGGVFNTGGYDETYGDSFINFGTSPDGFGFAPSSSEVKRELAAEGINIEAIHALDFNNQDIPAFRPDLMEKPNIHEEDEFN